MRVRRELVRTTPTLAVIDRNGTVRICAAALLTGVPVATFRAVAEQMCTADVAARMQLDLSRVTAISRPGALMLLECTRRAERAGIKVLLHQPSPVVTERIDELSLTAAFATTEAGVEGTSARSRAMRPSAEWRQHPSSFT